VLTNTLFICWLNIIEILGHARYTLYQDRPRHFVKAHAGLENSSLHLSQLTGKLARKTDPIREEHALFGMLNNGQVNKSSNRKCNILRSEDL
jgi:hypothetical protein